MSRFLYIPAILSRRQVVTLLSPDGQESTYGEGLPLGWRPDGQLLLVRWPDHRYLRTPGL